MDRGRGAGCALVVVCAAVLLSARSAVSQTAGVAVSPGAVTVSSTKQVTLHLNVSDVSDLHAAEVRIVFDTSVLHFDQVTAGGFLPDAFMPTPYITGGPGYDTLTVDQAILGPGGTSGSGTLFSVQFTGESPGVSLIRIQTLDLRSISNAQIPCTRTDGQVTVGPPPITANLKVMLQGPYSGSSMSTAMRAAGVLPLAHPYGVVPWSYAGTETVGSIPAGVVDWVLVQLRSNTTTTVATRAAFLRSDGTVVDLDGTSQVDFNGIAAGSYYIVVRHRNHVGVMSASAVPLSTSSTLYDFTDWAGGQKAYGDAGAMKNLGSNVYGMWSGDADGNSGIGASDLVRVRTVIGLNTYHNGDIDMNAGVGASDLVVIRANIGRTTQIP